MLSAEPGSNVAGQLDTSKRMCSTRRDAASTASSRIMVMNVSSDASGPGIGEAVAQCSDCILAIHLLSLAAASSIRRGYSFIAAYIKKFVIGQ